MNRLIDEVSKTKSRYVGLLLLITSVILRTIYKLIEACDKYTEAHGLLYNETGSELLCIKRVAIVTGDSLVTLCGTSLKRVSDIKYLGLSES